MHVEIRYFGYVGLKKILLKVIGVSNSFLKNVVPAKFKITYLADACGSRYVPVGQPGPEAPSDTHLSLKILF